MLHSQKIDDRYSYYVDFYIKSRDLFIEMNTDASHRGHWFDPESKDDQVRLADLQKKMSSSERTSRYRNFIRVWTVTDPEKRACAKRNNLNYLAFWDNSFQIKDGEKYPKLRDLREWIAAGCPDAQDWPGHEVNKY